MRLIARKRRRRAERTPPAESRVAEAVTVAWSLCIFAGTVAVGGATAAVVALRWSPEAAGLALLVELLFFTALVVGTVSVLLLPAVLFARSQKPPQSLVVFSLLIAAVPWAAAAWRFLM